MAEKRPYKLHTNRELKLMLAGTKPLAAFLYREGEDETFYLGRQPFQKHVDLGVIVRRDRIFSHRGAKLQLVLFALPGEEWRFKAYELMWQLAEVDGWNDTLERMEGTLLGYEEWQNDWHMADRKRKQDDI